MGMGSRYPLCPPLPCSPCLSRAPGGDMLPSWGKVTGQHEGEGREQPWRPPWGPCRQSLVGAPGSREMVPASMKPAHGASGGQRAGARAEGRGQHDGPARGPCGRGWGPARLGPLVGGSRAKVRAPELVMRGRRYGAHVYSPVVELTRCVFRATSIFLPQRGGGVSHSLVSANYVENIPGAASKFLK